MAPVRRRGWKGRLLRILLWTGVALLLLFGLAFYLLYAPSPPEPALSARPVARTVGVGALDRKYLFYAPARLAPGAPLLIVFHGSMGSSANMRVMTGFEFDRLADQHGFAVAYPQGFEGYWNDCRRTADYSARRQNIDDIGFFEALVEQLRRERNIDSRRVFVAGLSNGGHFVMRLALERPELVAGAAVFAASLPVREDNVCTQRGTPPPILLVNGTDDPISPHEGGTVTLFGFGNRGQVHSARKSAAFFAGSSGAAGPVTTRLEPRDSADRTWADRSVWRGPAGGEVMLLSVHGGGHVVPQPRYRPARLLGRSTTAINGPKEAWDFFRRQPPASPGHRG